MIRQSINVYLGVIVQLRTDIESVTRERFTFELLSRDPKKLSEDLVMVKQNRPAQYFAQLNDIFGMVRTILIS